MTKKFIIIAVFVVGLVMRLYRYEELFLFAHDQDLYSWIAKDIVINKHIRLVGQVTSVDGVFIGPAYYYYMALFYWLSAMNPISGVMGVTIIGMATIISFYYFGTKYFGPKIGLILMALYSFSWGAALFDRWSVPTQPTVLWSIWFLYVIFGALKGKINLLPIYGLLLGLVYHIHIALLPILPLPILAYWLSNEDIGSKLKKIALKNVIISASIFFLVSSPFWIFEIKHNFSQVKSTIVAMKMETKGPTGIQKINKVIDAAGREWQIRLIKDLDQAGTKYFLITNLIIILGLLYKSKLNSRQWLMISLWIILIFLAQFSSKKVVSEYYFTNLVPIYFLLVALFIDRYIKQRSLTLGLVVSFGIINMYWMIKHGYNSESYYERIRVVDYIKQDTTERGLPCVGINYIANFGTGVGFRYLFWYRGVNVIRPGNDVPIYDIVIPWQTSGNQIDAKFGRFGVIKAKSKIVPTKETCESNSNKLDPLLGYTE